MKMELVKVQPKPDVDAFILAMFLMFARAPRKAEPEVDGAFDLGEVGQVVFENQRLLRETPYSVCRGVRE